MCKDIEIEVDDSMLQSIASLMNTKLENICDRCSMEIYAKGRDNISTNEDLFHLIGVTMFNSLLVDSLEISMEKDE